MIRKLLAGILLGGSLSLAYAESCYPINTPTLVFSPYRPLDSQPGDIETSIDFYCAPAFQGGRVHVSVSIQAYSQSSGYQLRNNVGDILRFSLFIDPARSIPIANGMNIPLYAVNSGAKTFSIVLYGRIPPNQRTAGIGHYRGFVNLLLSY